MFEVAVRESLSFERPIGSCQTNSNQSQIGQERCRLLSAKTHHSARAAIRLNLKLSHE